MTLPGPGGHRPLLAITTDVGGLARIYGGWSDLLAGFAAQGADFVAFDSVGPHLEPDQVGACHGVVLTGGEDVDVDLYRGPAGDPAREARGRDLYEIAILQQAMALELPILAICRGAQLVNVALGGDLYGDIATERPGSLEHAADVRNLGKIAHPVELVPESRVSAWLGGASTIDVNSAHHQAVRRLAEGLRVTARSSDGVIEGFEHPDRPLTAVQWHPELNWRWEATAARLLHGFVVSCQRSGSGRP